MDGQTDSQDIVKCVSSVCRENFWWLFQHYKCGHCYALISYCNATYPTTAGLTFGRHIHIYTAKQMYSLDPGVLPPAQKTPGVRSTHTYVHALCQTKSQNVKEETLTKETNTNSCCVKGKYNREIRKHTLRNCLLLNHDLIMRGYYLIKNFTLGSGFQKARIFHSYYMYVYGKSPVTNLHHHHHHHHYHFLPLFICDRLLYKI